MTPILLLTRLCELLLRLCDRSRRRIAAFMFLCTLLWPGVPRAQDDDETRALRLLFAQGLTLEGAGRWADALERFEAIARVRPTPNVRYHIGLCNDRLGRLVEAERTYRGARDVARVTAPEVIGEIDARLQELDGRMPRLVITIAGERDGVTVLLDGEPVQPSKVVRTDPGPHVAVAMRHGIPVAASAFSIHERRTRYVTLKVHPLEMDVARR